MSQDTRAGGSLPDPPVVDRVVDAVLAELAESGRERLSMDRVARRAGVSTTTVYTRWRTKDQLLVAAYRRVSQPFPVVATGTLHGDLDAEDIRSLVPGSPPRRRRPPTTGP